jgi:branched-chain amino acid transport system ATP-binding protein
MKGPRRNQPPVRRVVDELTDIMTLDNIVKAFGGNNVIDGLSFSIQERDVVGIVGPNGAGKTTLINTISGMYALDGGAIYFKGERIDKLKTHQIVRKGLARSFQIPKPFKKMTVTENLTVPMLAMGKKPDYGRIQEILATLKLTRVADEKASNISVGQQKLLEIGRMLALDPQLLMLDEPTAGVHPELRKMITQILRGVNDKTLMIVSHDLNFVKELCNHIIVMNAGKKLVEGGLSCLQDPLVIEAYLGKR